jgi:hypothetical protein
MLGTSGEVKTARELGITGAPPYALFRYIAFVIDDGVDALNGLRRWITKRKWMPVN